MRKEMKKYSKEERRKAVAKGFANRDKRSGNWYLVDEAEFTKLGIKKFEAKIGTSYITILPRTDAPEFFMEIFVHYGVGPNNDAFLCVNRMYGDNCPVCNFGRKLHDEGEDKEVTREYFPTKRILVWVVDSKDVHSISDGVQLYEAPKTVFDNIAELSTDDRTGETIDISDFEEKVTFVFKKTGKGLTTNYSGFKLEEWQDDIPEEYYENLPNMEKLLKKPDIKTMEKAIGIGSKEEDADEYINGEEEEYNETNTDTDIDRDTDEIEEVDIDENETEEIDAIGNAYEEGSEPQSEEKPKQISRKIKRSREVTDDTELKKTHETVKSSLRSRLKKTRGERK